MAYHVMYASAKTLPRYTAVAIFFARRIFCERVANDPSKVERDTSTAEVNELLKTASEGGELKSILGFETRPLVSTDYTNDERSSIIDARSTMVVDGTCVKVRQICI